MDPGLYGSKCALCELAISPNELVMKALDNIYHVECFKCDECGDRLEKGDEFILKDEKLYCSADFNVAEQRSDVDLFSSDEYESMSTTSPRSPKFDEKNNSLGGGGGACKRPRTILTSQQREDFKAAFEITPKPCRKVREQLSTETGLSVRVVQVWFQNQRAKLKKIQKKAEEGPDGDKIRKINNNNNNNPGKIAKRRKSKPISSSKSPENEKPEFHLPLSSDLTHPFTNILDTNDSYTNNNNNNNTNNNNNNIQRSGDSFSTNPNLSFYTQNLDNPNLLTSHGIRTTLTYPPGNFPRQSNISIDHVVSSNGIHPTPYTSNGFQMPTVSSDVDALPTAPTTVTNFQLMPHLMNSFI